MAKLLAILGAIAAAFVAFVSPARASATVAPTPRPAPGINPTVTTVPAKPATKAPPEPGPLPPRGIRNHNPGNVRTRGTRNGIGGRDPWLGLIGEDLEGYGIFSTAELGIRAMVRDLLVGFERDGENTIREIITEWAPSTENDTAAYIASVAKQTGFHPDQELALDALPALVRAIIRHENGQQPYSAEVIASAIARARR